MGRTVHSQAGGSVVFQRMMSAPETMSYNDPWGGCIDYLDEVLPDWYSRWVGQEPQRFYAYIKRTSDGVWIGDVNFHYTPEKDWWDMGIVIYAPYRGKGYWYSPAHTYKRGLSEHKWKYNELIHTMISVFPKQVCFSMAAF